MTEQRQYDAGADLAHSSSVQHSGQSETPAGSASTAQAGPEAVAGPFTLRETVIGVSVLVMFIGTILPFVEGVNLWQTFSLFFLGIGILLPLAALALLIGRRLGSKRLRVGSLSVDQFASVVASFAVVFFFLQTVTTFGIGSFVALLGSVGFLAATVGGPHLGIFKPDFKGRPSSSAHPMAREILPARPRPQKPVPAETVSGWTGSTAGSADSAGTGGPSSTGYTAGYAVAGYAAGQLPGAGERQDQHAAPASRQVPAAEAGETKAEASAEQEKPVSEPAPTMPVAKGTPEAHGATAVASSSDAQRESAQQAAPAPTMAQPTVEKARQESASQPAQAAEPAHPQTESISATREAEDEEPVLEAFWFAVGTPRSVVDEQTGAPLFVLQPGDWEVGIEDRGHEFLVQDKRTGRIGVMRDLRNIERAPREG
ncbi:hypothetical protein GC088_12305 [Arthrobacter sp. JZ12]|uniref:hypothetical protein n=1 Tax=Arthrobacter sp. JZ12 TaxID=2654190 RepID=UPI002B491070|nr:hypothetical protein [Arthrobacter sp. JZ12]WRH25772.1 hypothetical protein GC088_12305 [Arthrobacter sp. JZ12]